MLKQISVIAFDLDDTLWPCMPTIVHAEEKLYKWLELHCPRITQGFSPLQLVESRKQFMQRNEQYSIDLSLMRHEFLKFIAAEFQYDSSQVADSAFEVFYQARQKVTFYQDVLPSLARLSSNYKLGSITNGNANIEKVGLSHLIEHSVSACELKVAKPNKIIYQHLADCFGAPLEQVLYVGDHPVFDVIGPQQAGLQAVWINRDARDWPEELEPPKNQIKNLNELEALLLAHH